jgi:hypothetical protein
MMSFLTKPWIAPLAAGSATLLSALLGLPAQAADPCTSGLLIETIYNSGMTGYSCQFGDLTYNFSSDIVELKDGKPGGPAPMVNFETSGELQNVSFVNLYYNKDVMFQYTVTSSKVDILPYDLMTAVLQTYTQDPDTPSPADNTVDVNPLLPMPPNAKVTMINVFYPYSDPADPFPPEPPRLTSLSNTIRVTPGPLPVVGAGLTFAMSRKLRQRIKQVA